MVTETLNGYFLKYFIITPLELWLEYKKTFSFEIKCLQKVLLVIFASLQIIIWTGLESTGYAYFLLKILKIQEINTGPIVFNT